MKCTIVYFIIILFIIAIIILAQCIGFDLQSTPTNMYIITNAVYNNSILSFNILLERSDRSIKEVNCKIIDKNVYVRINCMPAVKAKHPIAQTNVSISLRDGISYALYKEGMCIFDKEQIRLVSERDPDI